MTPTPKYELTDETREVAGRTLRRIRARSNFGAVSAGDVGGWIESEGNLAQTGAAWVYGDARVSGAAWVSGDARVSGAAHVYGAAQVSGAARVCGDAWVSGAARVSGAAWVYGDARVCGDAHLLCIGPIGSRHAILTVTRDKGLGLRFTTGCFSGSGAEFAAAVAETHEEGSTARIEYDAAIAMVDAWTQAHEHPAQIATEAA